MAGQDIGVLCVLIIESGQFPVRTLTLLCVLEFGHMAEDSYLLDEVLERLDVDGVSRASRGRLHAFLLRLFQLGDPDGNNLFQFRAD